MALTSISSMYNMPDKPSILDVLAKCLVIGDGSYLRTLEERGYVHGGLCTPEAVIKHPSAVTQLHKDFAWAGADVLQALTFNDGKLKFTVKGKDFDNDDINQAACEIVKAVAEEYNVFVCGGVNPTPAYKLKGGKEEVQRAYHDQLEVLLKNNVDFLLAEFVWYIEDAEWAIEVLKTANRPVACTMRIGPAGDGNGVSPGQCAIRMARAGADIVGINCQYDINTCMKTIKLMKEALDAEGLKPFLMTQPIGYWSPETENSRTGFSVLPEYPLALEPRQVTRFDVRRYAREAYNIGVRYIGGCCGFKPYHIREIAEELATEKGKGPPGAEMSSSFGQYMDSTTSSSLVHTRIGREYWMNLPTPATKF